MTETKTLISFVVIRSKLGFQDSLEVSNMERLMEQVEELTQLLAEER